MIFGDHVKRSHTYLSQALFPQKQTNPDQVHPLRTATRASNLPREFTRESPTLAHRTEKRPYDNRSYRLHLAVSSTFDSLFKVLFTFPSRYLCAIGLQHVFSFGWTLPPD